MTSADSTRAVSTALDKLASKGAAWQIRDYLLAHDHRGERFGGFTCPVSNYLRAATGTEVLICQGGWLGPADHADAALRALPGEVPAFVTAFDNRDYPELVKR